MVNGAQPPIEKDSGLFRGDPTKGEREASGTSAVTVFATRWYLRIIGIALIGYACIVALSQRPPLAALLLVESAFVLLGVVAVVSSFFVKRKAEMEILALLIALFAGILLFGPTIQNGATSFLVATSIDQQRSQFIAALLLTAGTGLLGGLFGRRKLGACLGAGVVFWFGYLANFIQVQIQPAHDPGGHLEPLNGSAFIHTLLVMGALALLSAFIGAAVGVALSEVIFNPPLQAIRLIRQRAFPQQATRIAANQGTQRVGTSRSNDPSRIAFSWLGAGMLIVFFVLASSSAPLFIYSPDVGLHNPPENNGGNQQIPSQGTLVQESMASQALGGKTEAFYVYLPPTYNTPQGQNKHYPSLYLLHGSPGTYKDWVTAGNAVQSADTLMSSGKTPEAILVFPDGNGQISPSEWGNSYNQQQMIETFVTVDLVHYVDQKYRTIPQAADRGIGGLSMGGFGSMNIAVQHPDIFGTVIALGGYYQADGSASVWGNNADYIKQNSPIDVLPNNQAAWKLHIFLGAGTQDVPYYEDTREFAHVLDSLSIPYHLDVENGAHSWQIWGTQLYNALLWIKWG